MKEVATHNVQLVFNSNKKLRAGCVCCYLFPSNLQVIKVNAQEKLVAIKLTTLPPGVEPTPKGAAEVPPAEQKAE